LIGKIRKMLSQPKNHKAYCQIRRRKDRKSEIFVEKCLKDEFKIVTDRFIDGMTLNLGFSTYSHTYFKKQLTKSITH